MPDLFVDTSGWGHLFDKTQAFHIQASDIYRVTRTRRQKMVTTNYVVTELAALLTSPLQIPRRKTVAIIESLKSSPFVEVVHVDISLDADEWQLFRTRLDKEWSLVDCASFVVMKARSATEALTTDHHFEQAGFIRLLK